VGPPARHHRHHRAREVRSLRSPSNALMSTTDRPILTRNDHAGAPGTVAHAGVDPTLEGRAPRDALRRAIAMRRGYCSLGRRPRKPGGDAPGSGRARLLWHDAGGSPRLDSGVAGGTRDRRRPVPGLRMATTRRFPIDARLIAISGLLRLGATYSCGVESVGSGVAEVELADEMIATAMATADAWVCVGNARCCAFRDRLEDARQTCTAKGRCTVGWHPAGHRQQGRARELGRVARGAHGTGHAHSAGGGRQLHYPYMFTITVAHSLRASRARDCRRAHREEGQRPPGSRTGNDGRHQLRGSVPPPPPSFRGSVCPCRSSRSAPPPLPSTRRHVVLWRA